MITMFMADYTVEERRAAEAYWNEHPELTYIQCLTIVAEDKY